MGRAGHHGQSELVRIVDGVLVVAGAPPAVWRVLELKPGSVTGFIMAPVPGEYFEGGATRWPAELFSHRQLIEHTGLMVAPDLLQRTDLLHIWWGSAKYFSRGEGYFSWHMHGHPWLAPLTLLEVRAALRSPWLHRLRTSQPDGIRGIILRS